MFSHSELELASYSVIFYVEVLIHGLRSQRWVLAIVETFFSLASIDMELLLF